MFSHKHYVPVLKGKQGEFSALAGLKSTDGITPLMEAIPPTKEAKITTIPDRMNKVWKRSNAYFIDFVFVDNPDPEVDEGKHPLEVCFDRAAELGHKAIPVTGTGRSESYQQAVTNISKAQKQGVALRLAQDDFADEDELRDAIESVISIVEVKRKMIDLIIDVNTVFDLTETVATSMGRGFLDIVPFVSEWRTLTMTTGSFPRGLANLTRDTWNVIPRTDWRSWRRIITSKNKPERLPAFGDFAIAHPDLPPVGQSIILAQLRYTAAEDFLVWKGENAIKKGYAQFNGICKKLIKRDEYRGPEFSQGDAEIAAKATTAGSPGSATTWRMIGTNHHVETVREQIASLP